MNVIMLGAPGAGKGTQASKLAVKYNIPHISTGDIFRENIKNSTPIGVVAKSYIDKGQLVPDTVTVSLVEDRLKKDDCKNGYLLDGFPRNVSQAEALSKISKIDYVVNIDVHEDKLLHRIIGRRICKDCGESYHIDVIGNAKTCRKCGGELITRADDNEATVKSRLDVYNTQTQPLIEYYKNQGNLVDIDGEGAVEEIFERIVKILG